MSSDAASDVQPSRHARPVPFHASSPSGSRSYSLLHALIAPGDHTLRTWLVSHNSNRPYSAVGIRDTVDAARDRRHTAALMRVNHSGEVAAQALYQGQASVARNAATRDSLMAAAREETDHLAWCSTRIEELGGRTSLLNPLWY